MKSGEDFGKGILLGAALGAIAVIALAPKAREEVGEQVKDKISLIKRKVVSGLEQGSEDADEFLSKMIDAGKITKREASDLVNKIRRSME